VLERNIEEVQQSLDRRRRRRRRRRRKCKHRSRNIMPTNDNTYEKYSN
jgi:hypothetical protein